MGSAAGHRPAQAAGRNGPDDHFARDRVLVFALTPLAGIALAGSLPQDAHTFGALNGLLVGILLHIATTILFETADGHEFNGKKFLTVLMGLALSLLTTHL